ncbi:hypothetical protein OROMI_017693 [Orobanche minor]
MILTMFVLPQPVTTMSDLPDLHSIELTQISAPFTKSASTRHYASPLSRRFSKVVFAGSALPSAISRLSSFPRQNGVVGY